MYTKCSLPPSPQVFSLQLVLVTFPPSVLSSSAGCGDGGDGTNEIDGEGVELETIPTWLCSCFGMSITWWWSGSWESSFFAWRQSSLKEIAGKRRLLGAWRTPCAWKLLRGDGVGSGDWSWRRDEDEAAVSASAVLSAAAEAVAALVVLILSWRRRSKREQ